MSNSLSLFEKNQRVRTLSAIIWIVLIASVALGLLNIQFRTWDSVIALFSLAFICVLLLWLNSSGHYTLSALILSIVVLMVINLNLFDGDGLRDSGILAYPIFIMIGVLFFGKRATPYFSLAAIASTIGIVYLEINGYIHPTIGATTFDILLPIVILLLAAAAFIWVVVGNMEKDLERVKESEALEQELKIAADIQRSILPDRLPLHEKFDFGARILPARQVGGDFYDCFYVDHNRIAVLIGDVADKGIPSAIFMARVHALITAEAESSKSAGDVLRKVNKHITQLDKSSQFVTALYGILDAETGEFSYARAGHEPPFYLNSQGEIRRLPHKTGMALGLQEQITLDQASIFLSRGSLLIMFTDGLTDCRNPKGDAFGLERIRSTLADLKNNSAQAVCDQLFDTLMMYQSGSKQDDDVTLVAVHAK